MAGVCVFKFMSPICFNEFKYVLRNWAMGVEQYLSTLQG